MKTYPLLIVLSAALIGCSDSGSDPGTEIADSAVPDGSFLGSDAVIASDMGPNTDASTSGADEGVEGLDVGADPFDAAPDSMVDAAVEEDAGEVDPTGLTPLALEESPADAHYRQMWWTREGEFVTSLKWLPHFIYEQGYVSTCVRLEMRRERTLTGEDVEDIRRMIEDGVQAWQLGLVGEENWPDIPLAEVRLFGVAHTDAVELIDPPDVPIYVNAEAKCPDSCSRFHQKHVAEPDYSACPRQDLDHFDFTSWYSDFDFGAAGHGGDWGTRLNWVVHLDELNGRNQRVTIHEIGHIAGLPDIYGYPQRDAGHRRPVGIMATANEIHDFDYLMLRRVWAAAFEAFYAE